MPQPRDLNSDVRVTCEVICANFSLAMYGILEFNAPLDIGHFGDRVFLGLSVLDLGPMYATDIRQHHCFIINNVISCGKMLSTVSNRDDGSHKFPI